MGNPKMNFIFTSEDSRRLPSLEPNEILNEFYLKATLIKEEIGIYSQARLTITSLLAFY